MPVERFMNAESTVEQITVMAFIVYSLFLASSLSF
jgi:hypothetical protein